MLCSMNVILCALLFVLPCLAADPFDAEQLPGSGNPDAATVRVELERYDLAGSVHERGVGNTSDWISRSPNQELCRNSITSPSCTTYSLPSIRSLPVSRAFAVEPASTISA